MHFCITYDGELKSAGGATRSAEKWAIRRKIHPQLAELWEVHPALMGQVMLYAVPDTAREAGLGGQQVVEEAKKKQREVLRAPISVGGHNCVPIVRKSLFLMCSLNILFLRKEGPGSLVASGGDLDNRIKTLFDGLRMPTADEAKAEKANLDPLFCLLEDDALITDVTIRTDRLLSRPGSSPSEVRLVIDVDIHPTHVRRDNSGFLGR
jgi:hypothetical protein